MKAALRDAKIAAAKAEGRQKPVTTLAQRRAARWAATHAGWRRAAVPTVTPPSGPTPPKRPLPRDERGRVPRYSTEGMARSRKPHAGALRGGKPKYNDREHERRAA